MSDRFGGGGPLGPGGSGRLPGPAGSGEGIKELQIDIEGYQRGPSHNSARDAAEGQPTPPTKPQAGTREDRPAAPPRANLVVRAGGDFLTHVTRLEYIYSILGLVLGLSTIIGGVILGLHGVTGSTSWTAKVLGLESKVNDAAPGVVLFIVGVFLVFITRPKIRLRNIQVP